jgi:integrase
MICFDRGLIAYTERYLLAHSVSYKYANNLRARVAAFCKWCGADVEVDSLSCELVNDWLAELETDGMTAYTLDGYRRALLSIWNAAYLERANDNAPSRLRRVKKPRLIIEAYTHTELRQLLDTAAKLRTLHVDDNKAADFWQAAIHAGYSCGARLGDVLTLEWRHVTPDGVLTFLQSKTQYANTVRLSAEAMKFARRLGESKYVLPWPYQVNWFCLSFQRLKKAAGIKRGSFKWIRRSAGSYAEAEQPGSGGRLLGHRDERMFRRHYEDSSITAAKPIEPPPLLFRPGE